MVENITCCTDDDFLSADTLPPYLMPLETSSPKDITKGETELFITEKSSSIRPPVPVDHRGVELTFPETGQQKVFMMAKSNAFIQLDGNRIPTFQLR